MEWLWTWSGRCFGYKDGENLWTHDGHHVGKFHGSEIYGSNGRYLGELIDNNRLIRNLSKTGLTKSLFSPYASRVGYVKYADYVGYAMYAGYEDFPHK